MGRVGGTHDAVTAGAAGIVAVMLCFSLNKGSAKKWLPGLAPRCAADSPDRRILKPQE